ncbi:hypothetical protein GCM10010103_66090 [Streptomyces paradoxus]|uniref:Uncharacterized protein n=1 Tax=Streptomyces paradoxus TaxID=66375 RepID=A0A7W9TJV8_9ACTN|nr:hypothetical protein [Streptomyces paradoxus]MBB6080982.1 hypothetical protein [Streptomyces paradoxus]
MAETRPVREYTGMATLSHAFYVVDMGEPEGIALPSMTSDIRITATESNSCLTITAGSSEWEPVKISFLVYDQEPEPPAGEWRHTETFTCTGTDTPASFTTGTDPDDMFQDPPPEGLFHRPGIEPPYHWTGRLLIAARATEEHVLQFWPGNL